MRPLTRCTVALLSTALLATATPPAMAAAADDTREPVVTAARADPPRALLSGPTALGFEPRLSRLPVGAGELAGDISTTLTTGAGNRYLGPALSGLVINAANGTVVWRYRDGRARLPASTQKLLTAYTVLHSTDPEARLTTRVLQNSSDRGRIHLRGGGDPSLTTRGLATLAARTATALAAQRRTRVTLSVDASIFPAPSMAGGWKASYRRDVQPPQGLTLAGYRKSDGAAAAGRSFAALLRRRGITVGLTSASGAPSGSPELARVSSVPIRRLLATMLSTSNNDYAEFLLRHAALAAGARPSWAGSTTHATRVLARAGVPTRGLRIADGSGLSRSNRMPAATLAGVVRLLWTTPEDAAIVFAWGAIPRSGQSGTLATRYRTSAHSCARGKVLAKTGTLADAVTLAGVAHGVDGVPRVFVFLENGRVGVNTRVRYAVDTLATTVVGCRLTG